jgi:hypothetical protein
MKYPDLSQAQLLSLVSICHTITAVRLEESGADLAPKNRLQELLIGTIFFSAVRLKQSAFGPRFALKSPS